MKLSKISAAALLAFMASGAFAQAKAPEPDYTLSYNVGAVTDYRFRGISQTSLKPAVQAGVDFTHKNGVYLGAWASNVSWIKDFNGATKGSLEVDLFGGYKGEIAKDLGFDVGAIAYAYPGNNSGAAGTPGAGGVTKADTQEIYGALTYKIFTVKYSRSLGTFLGFLQSSGSGYLDLSAAMDLGNGLTLTPHLGMQTVKNNKPFNYTDYSLTLAKDMGNGLSVSGALVGTDAKKGGVYTNFVNNTRFIGGSTVVLGAKYSF